MNEMKQEYESTRRTAKELESAVKHVHQAMQAAPPSMSWMVNGIRTDILGKLEQAHGTAVELTERAKQIADTFA